MRRPPEIGFLAGLIGESPEIEGVIRALRGEWQDGIAACQYAVEQAPDLYNTAESLCFLGVAYLEAGDTTQAVAVLERAVQQESEFQARTDQGWFNAWLGEAYLLDGQADKAGQSARHGLELARKAGYRVAEGSAQRVLGNVSLDMGNLSEAAIHLSGALEIFEAIEAPYFKGRTHQDLARLAHARGDEAAVKSNLREAELTFARLRALAHLERTKRLHVELQVRAGSA